MAELGGVLDRARLFACCAALLSFAAGAAAQTDRYPDRPLRIVVGFPPGGAADFSARLLAQHLQPTLGQTVVVDNRGGAFGNIANDIAAKSAPDGYTLLINAEGTITINPSIHSKLPYDPQRDLTPITQLITYANVLVAHPGLPANSVQELIALAKARKLSYAHPGVGSVQQMAAELFKMRTGVDLISVPYKGGGPAMIALMGNETQLSFATPPSSIPHVKSGRLKALAVTSARRFSPLADLPTIAESGLAGYDVPGWIGLFAPGKTPGSIVARLHKEAARIMHLPDVKEKVIAGGAESGGVPPEEARAIIRRDTETWAKVVRSAGIKVE